ncbi:23512_t:CDS:1, partial [Racocetra persica]
MESPSTLTYCSGCKTFKSHNEFRLCDARGISILNRTYSTCNSCEKCTKYRKRKYDTMKNQENKVLDTNETLQIINMELLLENLKILINNANLENFNDP